MEASKEKSGVTAKLRGKICQIREQILRDGVLGLTLQFELVTDGNTRVRLFGSTRLGNREFIFDQSGSAVGAGTCVRGLARPTWLTDIDDVAA